MSDSYLSTADAADSYNLQRRVSACAAQEGAPGDPVTWAVSHRYAWASAPGWGAAWESATISGNPDPGADPTVISDGMILTETQALLGVITPETARQQRAKHKRTRSRADADV